MRAGLYEHALKKLEDIGVVERHEEMREVFVQKRLNHALSTGVSPEDKLWRVAKAASLRESTIHQHINASSRSRKQ